MINDPSTWSPEYLRSMIHLWNADMVPPNDYKAVRHGIACWLTAFEKASGKRWPFIMTPNDELRWRPVMNWIANDCPPMFKDER